MREHVMGRHLRSPGRPRFPKSIQMIPTNSANPDPHVSSLPIVRPTDHFLSRMLRSSFSSYLCASNMVCETSILVTWVSLNLCHQYMPLELIPRFVDKRLLLSAHQLSTPRIRLPTFEVFMVDHFDICWIISSSA
ncbi:hypothetical protein NL676_015528 [Syzygium grande]|nr:hypothetical protein NL676_015528 [Syzygium grande]